MFNCEILADSLSPQDYRLTTMKIKLPRIVLSEFNTHRAFSRNSASSRAVPFNRMVKMVIENPFIPIAWQKEHSGMQGSEYLDPNKKYTFSEVQMVIHDTITKGYFNTESEEWDEDFLPIDEAMNKYVNPILSSTVGGLTCSEWWLKTRDLVVGCAYILKSFGVTKQICNRLLEPFMWHTIIVTATEWENFFNLRCPDYVFHSEDNEFDTHNEEGEYHFRSKKDAIKFFGESEIVEGLNKPISELTDLDWLNLNQSHAEIHIQAIAELMWDAYSSHLPTRLKAGEWHLPFGFIMMSVLDQQELHLKFPNIKSIEDLKVRICSARCGRISYETLGDNPKIDFEADIKLHDSLLTNGHGSPLEHCALTPEDAYTPPEYLKSWEKGFTHSDLAGNLWSRNFKGFIQYRALAGV